MQLTAGVQVNLGATLLPATTYLVSQACSCCWIRDLTAVLSLLMNRCSPASQAVCAQQVSMLQASCVPCGHAILATNDGQ
jgi:hypothetical protein